MDDAAGKLSLDGNQIFIAGGIDFESEQTLAIRIRATDQGGLRMEQVLVIAINDRNEPPIIDSATLSVPENSPNGMSLGVVAGRDPDAGSVLNWSISDGNSSGAFTINSLTGAISIARTDTLDFESVTRFILTLIAEDNGGLAATGSMTINIIDVNEPPANIELGSSTVAGGLPGGTRVGVFETLDPDSGDRFAYAFVPGTGSTDNASFAIVGNELRTRFPLDVARKPRYSIRIRSTDAGGQWIEKSLEIRVYGRAGRPTSLTTRAGNRQARLVWTTFADGISTATTTIVTGLANNTPYRFRVAAINLAGTGEFITTTTQTIPRAIPDPPFELSGTAGNGRVNLVWKPPASSGGTAIRFYTIELSLDGGTTWRVVANNSPRTSSAVVSGLLNGLAYRFRVSAVNLLGASWPSEPSQPLTPKGAPASPVGLAGTPGDRQVLLSWQPPASNGGEAIDDYVIQLSRNNGVSWTTLDDGNSSIPSMLIVGLINGENYLFRVAARNILGVGVYSLNSPAIRPRTTPDAPTIIGGTIGSGQVVLYWNAPTTNGGSPIVDYAIQYSIDQGQSWMSFPRTASSATLAVVTGLTNGVGYVFRVAAINVAGPGPYSTVSAAFIPRGLSRSASAGSDDNGLPLFNNPSKRWPLGPV